MRSLALVAVLALAACAAGPRDRELRALAEREPGLREVGWRALRDLAPHFWIAGGERLDFACHWGRERAVRVRVVGAASARERELVDLAVRAHARALAIDLASSDVAGEREIAVELVDGPAADDPRRELARSGDATADCRVAAPALAARAAARGPRIEAELVSASVRLARARADALGRVVDLDDDELFAALLHELGHALGFGGHSGAGDGILQRAPIEVRRIARGVRAGRALRDDGLRALYALPSGAILARAPADSDSESTVRVFAELARARGWAGAFSRAGDRSAELWWRMEDGRRVWLRAAREPRGTRWPTPLAIVANTAARDALREAIPR